MVMFHNYVRLPEATSYKIVPIYTYLYYIIPKYTPNIYVYRTNMWKKNTSPGSPRLINPKGVNPQSRWSAEVILGLLRHYIFSRPWNDNTQVRVNITRGDYKICVMTYYKNHNDFCFGSNQLTVKPLLKTWQFPAPWTWTKPSSSNIYIIIYLWNRLERAKT